MSSNTHCRDGEIAGQLDHHAQLAIDQPDRIHDHTASLHERIADSFGAATADRVARDMVLSVIDHRASLREIDWMLQRREDSLLAPDDNIEHYIVAEQPHLRTSRYRATPYEPFLNTLAYRHRGAYASLLAELTRDPADRLLRELDARERTLTKGRSTAHALLAMVPIEHVEITLVLLIARQRACTHNPDSNELLNLVLADLEMLARGTTLRRARLRAILPRFPSVTDQIANEKQWPDQSTDVDLFAGTEHVFQETEHPHATWRDPVLRDGPAPDPGFCTGRPILRPATHAARETVRAFFTQQAAHAGLRPDPPADGAFSSPSILFIIGARIAAQAPWTRKLLR